MCKYLYLCIVGDCLKKRNCSTALGSVFMVIYIYRVKIASTVMMNPPAPIEKKT